MPLKPMYPANNPVTVQLAQDLSSTDALIPVTDVSLFPAPPNFVTIGTEQNAETILYTGLDLEGGRLTGCQRGRFGTLSADWPAGEFIYHAWSPDNTNILMENILTLADEKASAQELLRLDDVLKGLEGSLQSLNEGKANATAVEEVAQSLNSLALRLDGLESLKADASQITRIDGELSNLSTALESKASVNALATKADMDQVEALTRRVYSVSLTAAGWSPSGDLFRHSLSLPAQDGDQADFSAPMPVLYQLAQDGILVHFENEGGILSAVASGQPGFDFSAQATLYKVVSGA